MYFNQIWHRDSKWGPGSSVAVKIDIQQNPRWRPTFCFNGYNSAIFAQICTKFCTGAQNPIPETDFASDFTSDKIQNGGGRHFEIHINGYNSVAIAYISIKFHADTKNDVPQEVLKSKFTSGKIEDGGGRHFEIQFNGHNAAILCINLDEILHRGSISRPWNLFSIRFDFQ